MMNRAASKIIAGAGVVSTGLLQYPSAADANVPTSERAFPHSLEQRDIDEGPYVVVEGNSAYKSEDYDTSVGNFCRNKSEEISVGKIPDNLEIDNALDVMSQQASMFDKLLPQHLLAHERETAKSRILESVRDILSDSGFLKDVYDTASRTPLDKIPKNLLSLSSQSIKSASVGSCDSLLSEESFPSFHGAYHPGESYCRVSLGLSWDDLVSEHPCVICNDLLAGPVILSCSHSFCGSCLVKHVDACESDDIEVSLCCPICRKEIVCSVFENILDTVITKKVENFPDCESKRDWTERRNKNTKYMKDENSKKNRTQEDYDEDSFLKKCIDVAYPVVAILVVIIIIILRKH
jgi:hypothetical protein